MFDQSESSRQFHKSHHDSMMQTLKINIHDGQIRLDQSNGALIYEPLMGNGLVSFNSVGKHSTKEKTKRSMKKKNCRGTVPL